MSRVCPSCGQELQTFASSSFSAERLANGNLVLASTCDKDDIVIRWQEAVDFAAWIQRVNRGERT